VAPPRRVALFVSCLTDQFGARAAWATVRLLRRHGVEVEVPAGQTCCGQPGFSTGMHAEARAVAGGFVAVFRDHEVVVTPSGSCAAMVREHYRRLFHGHPGAAAAAALAPRVRELAEFLVHDLGVTALDRVGEGSVFLHQACHGLRGLGLKDEHRRLLELAGYTVVASEEAVCCGFGGAFSIAYPAISGAMLEERIRAAVDSGARALVSGDTGCLMHLEGGLRRQGVALPVLHLAEALDPARGAAG